MTAGSMRNSAQLVKKDSARQEGEREWARVSKEGEQDRGEGVCAVPRGHPHSDPIYTGRPSVPTGTTPPNAQASLLSGEYRSFGE